MLAVQEKNWAAGGYGVYGEETASSNDWHQLHYQSPSHALLHVTVTLAFRSHISCNVLLRPAVGTINDIKLAGRTLTVTF